MEIGKLDDAMATIFEDNRYQVRPKNINGWLELLKCLYKADLLDDHSSTQVLLLNQN